MAWEIKRIDENDKEDLDYWLENGWQPFSVTSEVRTKWPYDDYRVVTYEQRVTVNVIWLRKHRESK